MGYNTRYAMEVIGFSDPEALVRQLRDGCEDAKFALTANGKPNNRETWYGHEGDLRAFSRKHPTLLFKLSGVGEEQGDIWDKYFRDGKMQACKAEVVKPPFNAELLT